MEHSIEEKVKYWLWLFHCERDVIHKTGTTVHNVLHCHQKRTKPWPQDVSLLRYASKQTRGHTDTQIAILTLTGGKVITIQTRYIMNLVAVNVMVR